MKMKFLVPAALILLLGAGAAFYFLIWPTMQQEPAPLPVVENTWDVCSECGSPDCWGECVEIASNIGGEEGSLDLWGTPATAPTNNVSSIDMSSLTTEQQEAILRGDLTMEQLMAQLADGSYGINTESTQNGWVSSIDTSIIAGAGPTGINWGQTSEEGGVNYGMTDREEPNGVGGIQWGNETGGVGIQWGNPDVQTGQPVTPTACPCGCGRTVEECGCDDWPCPCKLCPTCGNPDCMHTQPCEPIVGTVEVPSTAVVTAPTATPTPEPTTTSAPDTVSAPQTADWTNTVPFGALALLMLAIIVKIAIAKGRKAYE